MGFNPSETLHPIIRLDLSNYTPLFTKLNAEKNFYCVFLLI